MDVKFTTALLATVFSVKVANNGVEVKSYFKSYFTNVLVSNFFVIC